MHVHSTFSPDAVSTFEEYTKVVGNKMLEGIGFAEHVDFMPECGAFGYFDYTAFMNSIDEYRSRGYKFYAGAEIDYAARVQPNIESHLANHRYDYTIGSVHMIDGISISDGRNVECFRDIRALSCMLEKYYYEVGCSVESDKFDVIGHINIYRRYLDKDFFSKALIKRLDDLDHSLARKCLLSGKLIEVNSSGLFSAAMTTFPNDGFLKIYYDYGGRFVCMGSDAHNINQTARGFADVLTVLKNIGFEYVYLPWDRENPVKI